MDYNPHLFFVITEVVYQLVLKFKYYFFLSKYIKMTFNQK